LPYLGDKQNYECLSPVQQKYELPIAFPIGVWFLKILLCPLKKKRSEMANRVRRHEGQHMIHITSLPITPITCA
jgi:hypothetical protein